MVVGKTKQITVATLLEALKNRPKHDPIDMAVETYDDLAYRYDKWFVDFEGLLLQFQKQLFANIWELTEQELIRHKQAYPHRLLTFDNVHAIIHKVTEQILGDVAKQ